MSDHTDHHPAELTDVERRVQALEEILTEKGMLDPAFMDMAINLYANDIGPLNGAAVVAHAWIDDAYRSRLLDDGTAAIAELGFGEREEVEITREDVFFRLPAELRR